MVFSKIKFPISVLAFLLLSLVLLSLHLMSSATQESSELSELYSSLVLINAIGSVILLLLVGVNVYSLFRQLRKREAGSQLTIKMVLLFVFLSLAPAGIVFFYSVQFLDRSIDSWFNVEIDRAMDDALEISQVSLEQKVRDHLKQMERLAESIVVGEQMDIEVLRDRISADELTLLSSQGHIKAFSSLSSTLELPDVGNTLLTLGRGDSYAGLDSVKDRGVKCTRYCQD
jgi:Signal transduction histidine kinase involved in nitrogen fixation and metabolism regulation